MRKKTQAGMSLMEVMIAMGIIAISILGAISMVMFTTGTDQSARERNHAMDRAKTIMEQIQDEPFDDVFTNWNGFVFDVENLNPIQGDPDGRVGQVIVDNTDPELLDVTVLVEWRSMNKNTDLRFQTLLTRK